MVTQSTFGTLLHRLQANITYKCIREQISIFAYVIMIIVYSSIIKYSLTSLGFVTRHLKFHQKENAEFA